jgi:CheY-like chemotaxis protein
MSGLAHEDLMGGAEQTQITCVIADDHPAVLDSVSRVLAARGIGVVAQARDGEDALRAIEEHKPLVAVVDLHMPGLTGIGVARRIGRHTALILYTGYSDRALLIEALDAGVRGFVLKEAPLADVARAVETVAKGDVYVDPVLAGVLASGEAAQQLKMLTQRRTRSPPPARRRPRQRGDRTRAPHRGGDRPRAHPQRDAQARGRHAHARGRDGSSAVVD